MTQSNTDFVVDVMENNGFNVAPLREVSAIASRFIAERQKITKSADYTPQGKRNAIARLQSKTLAELEPYREKVAAMRTAASGKQAEAVAKWRGEVDPGDVREIRALVRKMDPMQVAGALPAAVARGDRVFVEAVRSSMNSEFPLATEEAWKKCEEMIAESAVDDATRNVLHDADSMESIVVEAEREIGG